MTLTVYLYDIDCDGVPEMMLTNGYAGRGGRAAYIFTYQDGETKYLDYGPTEGYYDPNDSDSPLYGCYRDAVKEQWLVYRKTGNIIEKDEDGVYDSNKGHPDYCAIIPVSIDEAVSKDLSSLFDVK